MHQVGTHDDARQPLWPKSMAMGSGRPMGSVVLTALTAVTALGQWGTDASDGEAAMGGETDGSGEHLMHL